VRNCRRFEEAAGRGSLLDKLFALEKRAVIAIEPPAREITRTGSVTALIEKWFPGAARSPGRLPGVLIDKVREYALHARDVVQASYTHAGAAETLVIRPYLISDSGKTYVILALDEIPHAPSVPVAWYGLLTKREREVTAKVLQGWNNRLIADDLRCAEDTVKKHVYRTFNKLGLSSRMQLVARANRER
jgi:DNA-binding CsgD family transcriptional regulator